MKLTWDTLSFPWRLAGTRTLDGGAAPACLDRLLRRLSIRRSVTLLSSPSQDEPAAFGLWRWRIVLPESAAERLSEDELTALLAHELAHLLRGDAIWLWVGRVLCCCLPFQLLNFLARRQWRRAGEFQCDEWAVRHGAHRLSLARCLTKVAEWRTEQRLCLAALAASGARSSLADRVERLVQARGERDSPVRRLVHELVWLAAAAATATLPWWGPRTALPAPPTRSTDADNSAARQFGSFDRVEPDRHSPPQPEGKPAWAAPGPDADHQQELRRAVAEESWKLKTELTRLERSLSALAETAERTGAEPAVQARLNSMRRRLADLHRLRAVLDRLGSAGAPGGTDSTGDGREWGFRLPEPSLVPEDL